MPGKKNHSLQGKKFCEPCGKDISTSYFSKHLKTIGHQRNADKNHVPKESSSESEASASTSSGDELKLDKIISSSEEESNQEQEQEQEQPVDEEKDSSQSEEEESEESKQEEESEQSEQSESESSHEPSPEPSPEPVKKKKSKRVKNVKTKIEKKQKPKPKKVGLYALSSSEEEEDNSVNPSGFLKFVNTLSNDFDITDPEEIKKIFNSVMGFGRASYHINPSVKNQLSRYLTKYERDNAHLEQDLVHEYLTNFLSDY
jgi:cobalamin biosynthesis protein CobT